MITLTAREKAVAAKVLLGWPNKIIGEALGISYRTVEEHRMHIYRKLGVHSAVELVRKEYGLDAIDLERARA
jgi:two-component system response regulator DctR